MRVANQAWRPHYAHPDLEYHNNDNMHTADLEGRAAAPLAQLQSSVYLCRDTNMSASIFDVLSRAGEQRNASDPSGPRLVYVRDEAKMIMGEVRWVVLDAALPHQVIGRGAGRGCPSFGSFHLSIWIEFTIQMENVRCTPLV